MLETVGSDPWITYGDDLETVRCGGKGASCGVDVNRFVPAHVAFDKVVSFADLCCPDIHGANCFIMI